MREIKLVVSDVDGTLLGHKTRTLSEATRKAIRKLQSNGIHFGLSSGRQFDQQLEGFYKDWGFDQQFDVLIGANGCQLYDGINCETFTCNLLDSETIKEIFDLVQDFKLDGTVIVNGVALCWSENPTNLISFYETFTNREYLLASSIDEMWQHDNCKVGFMAKDEEIPIVIDYVKAHGDMEKYNIFRTSPIMFEFSSANASKADALSRFCNRNKIGMNNVLAFGDATNDIEMLRAAGIGVSMLNGTEDAKAAADAITKKSADDDGLADFLENEFFALFD